MDENKQPRFTWIVGALGFVLWIAAGFLLKGSITMDTTVSADGMPTGRVANLQLLQVQQNLLIAGIGAATVGTLMIGFAAVVSALRGRS